MNVISPPLKPQNKLVDAVADWLRERARPDAQSPKTASLAHVCVVVPTARSGRELRLALARRFKKNGLVPPKIVRPMDLVVPPERAWDAVSGARAEASFLAFARAKGAAGLVRRWPRLFSRESAAGARTLLGFAAQLEELWSLLGEGGLLMRDVPAALRRLEVSPPGESKRWKELADLEKSFFAFLRKQGLRHRAEAVAEARLSPPPLPEGAEEVVLPALSGAPPVLRDILRKRKVSVLLHCDAKDCGRFDDLGRPVSKWWSGAEKRPHGASLRDADIVRAATDAALARRIAEEFPAAGRREAVPALGLCDEALIPELAGAFLARGRELRDPENVPLSRTAVGRVLDALAGLRRAPDGSRAWEPFARLMREEDVLRGLVRDDPGRRTLVLAGLDVCRNVFLPAAVPAKAAFGELAVELHPGDEHALDAFRAAAGALLGKLDAAEKRNPPLPEFLLAVLRGLYGSRPLPAAEEDARAFRAAALAARDALLAVSDGALAGLALAAEDRAELVRRTLAEASFRAESVPCDALAPCGWEDLAWSPAARIALAGFREGAVPRTAPGHPFFPDSLREALGLPTDADRLARDAFLLEEAVRSRAPGAVRAYVALASDAGDVHRPSRLLFRVPDADLPARAEALFGDLPAGNPAPKRVPPPKAWRPGLPDRVPLPNRGKRTPGGRLSASALGDWLGNPLSYLFRYGLGMKRVEEKDELGFDDFGTFVHHVLEDYAKEQIERRRQLADERAIRAALRRLVRKRRGLYGANPPLRLKLQLDAAESRLLSFAPIQARWARDGWTIFAAERGFFSRPFEGERGVDVPFSGSVDRIDFKKGVGYRLIDYKTWDEKTKALPHVLSSGAEQAGVARDLGLPVVPPMKTNAAARRVLGVQLPLYARCLEKENPATFGKKKIVDLCYLVLGEDEANTCVFGSAFDQGAFECQRTKTGKMQDAKLRLTELAPLALDTARRAVRAIRANLFWPPGPSPLRDADGLFLFSPEKDLEGSRWLAEQKRRLRAFVRSAKKGGRA